MNIRRWFLTCLSCAFLLIPALLFWSCDDDDDGGGGTPSFAIQFERINFADGELWVVLHNLAGDSALAAKQVGMDGRVQFDNPSGPRVSCSILRIRESWQFQVLSYLNVPGGEWGMDLSELPLTAVGLADVTTLYPPGIYSNLFVAIPGQTVSTYGVPDSAYGLNWPVYEPEDGLFSAFAQVSATVESGYCGQVLRQPFQSGTTNEYTVNLTQPYTGRTLETSRPCEVFFVRGYRGQTGYSYGQVDGGFHDAATTWRLGICDFPMDSYSIYALYLGLHERFSRMILAPEIPTAMDIPSTTISGIYNAQERQFEDVTVTGPADYVEGVWWQNSDSLNGSWYVLVSAQTRTIRRPELPDSLLAPAGIDPAIMGGRTLSGWDYGNVTNVDGAIRMLFKTPETTPPPYDRLFVFHTDLGSSPEMAQPRAEIPDPLHRSREW